MVNGHWLLFWSLVIDPVSWIMGKRSWVMAKPAAARLGRALWLRQENTAENRKSGVKALALMMK
jgi:hypothetical protein